MAALTPPLRHVTIDLARGDTDDPACTKLADEIFATMMAPHPKKPGLGAYQEGASVIVLPPTFEEYFSAIGPKRRYKWRVPQREGYSFRAFDRRERIDEIHAINTSMEVRQGRPMKDRYLERPRYGRLPDYACPRHSNDIYGVFDRDDVLVAYCFVKVVGDLVMFSTILGHGDHLEIGVMFLLVIETLRAVMAKGVRYAFYNLHSSGTDGLRFFKEQLLFEPCFVDWRLGGEAG